MAIIYNTATTLNGFLADEHNSLQWLFDVPGSEEAEQEMDTFLAGVSALVMGSTTYEWIRQEMDLLNHPEKWRDTYGDRPTWVFSSREREIPEGLNIQVINSPVVDALDQLRASAAEYNPEGDIWIMGGGELAGQFLDAGALDRITFTMAPVFLPSGAPLLPRRVESLRLNLAEMKQSGRFMEFTFDINQPPEG
ncbi:hypothetical protein COCCU_03150 [Corynebacterium occultum]|uniref:Bacterial bifunctional deaminase-reductase C-terminal domain-containing protein n=1 Tax=Corynebacterium occultum TaxID=2675219 RepID=A0A6B8VZ36_9CORY|nr:dihydrofolate reductase family protein [Corynebacterium occultum]QGU06584.1 hypothetical protein COCCU_03150 [Corynebacterium occultum]